MGGSNLSSFSRLTLLVLMLLVLAVSVSAVDAETYVSYGGADTQTMVLASFGDANNWIPPQGTSGGGNVQPGVISSGDYVIGDGECSEYAGESYVVSPVDCVPYVAKSFYDENTNLFWLLVLLLVLIAYIWWSKSNGEY